MWKVRLWQLLSWISFVLESRLVYFSGGWQYSLFPFWFTLDTVVVLFAKLMWMSLLQVCAIKAPGFGENRKSGLQDLAVLTGGEVSLPPCISLNLSILWYHITLICVSFIIQLITDELGMNLEKVDLDMLGTCKKVSLNTIWSLYVYSISLTISF